MQSVFEATGIGTGGVGEGGARLLHQGARDSGPRIAAGPCVPSALHCLLRWFEVLRCRVVGRLKFLIDKAQRAPLDDEHAHTPARCASSTGRRT